MTYFRTSKRRDPAQCMRAAAAAAAAAPWRVRQYSCWERRSGRRRPTSKIVSMSIEPATAPPPAGLPPSGRRVGMEADCGFIGTKHGSCIVRLLGLLSPRFLGPPASPLRSLCCLLSKAWIKPRRDGKSLVSSLSLRGEYVALIGLLSIILASQQR